MSKVIPILLLVGIFAFSFVSTLPSTTIPNAPISSPQANPNLPRMPQKSIHFCYTSDDCETSQMGIHSSCVSNACTCDSGYSKDSYGVCSVHSSFPVWTILLWVGGVLILVTIKGLIIVFLVRRRRKGRIPRRMLQAPAATISQQVPGVGVSPAKGDYPRQPAAVYPTAGHQQAPPMYATPYGNFQSQPQINRQAAGTANVYPTAPTN